MGVEAFEEDGSAENADGEEANEALAEVGVGDDRSSSKKGCTMASMAVMRLLGSYSSNRAIRSRASCDVDGSKTYTGSITRQKVIFLVPNEHFAICVTFERDLASI